MSLENFNRNKPLESQLASNKNSGFRSNGRSSGGNGSEVQEVVGGPGLVKDGETLESGKEHTIGA